MVCHIMYSKSYIIIMDFLVKQQWLYSKKIHPFLWYINFFSLPRWSRMVIAPYKYVFDIDSHAGSLYYLEKSGNLEIYLISQGISIFYPKSWEVRKFNKISWGVAKYVQALSLHIWRKSSVFLQTPIFISLV